MAQPPCLLARGYQPFPSSVVTTLTQVPSRGNAPFVSIDRRGSRMALSARPIRYIVSGLPTPSRATTGRRPLTPHTTTQVWLFKQLLDKQTAALLVLPQIRGSVSRVSNCIPRVSSDGIIALTPVFLQRLRCGTSHGGSFAPHR